MAQLLRCQEWIAWFRCLLAVVLHETLVWVRRKTVKKHPRKVVKPAKWWLPIPEELSGWNQARARSILPSLQDDLERSQRSQVSKRVRLVGSARHSARPLETLSEPPHVQLRLGSWWPHSDELIDGYGIVAVGRFHPKLLHWGEYAGWGHLQDSLQIAVDHTLHGVSLSDNRSCRNKSQQS